MDDNPYRSPAAAHDPYSAIRLKGFRLFLAGNTAAIFGMQMQTVAVGWEIYERTGSAMALAWVGFVQVLPVIFLALPSGHVSDRFDRQRIVVIAAGLMALASLTLAWLSWHHGPLPAMYACLLVSGICRAFQQPAKASFLPQIVPRELFPNAVTWNLGAFQLAAIVGPAIGGFMIAWWQQAFVVYLCDAAAMLWFAAMVSLIVRPATVVQTSDAQAGMSFHSLTAGSRFVLGNKVLLGAMALDMFAVLLGGATTLLPIYAKDILQVGATGLGWMRAAPAAGALLMSLYLAHRPPLQHAGWTLLAAVAGFGVATIVFGFSRSFELSLAMLFFTGLLDVISVVIRHTLVQLLTPDAMRGRVSAINGMFIGASNELGGFESGMVAAYFTPQISVASGGVGTLLVVAVVAMVCRQLRQYGRLDIISAVDEAEAAPRSTHHPAAADMGSPETEPGPTRSVR
jgi:MFS family permease